MINSVKKHKSELPKTAIISITEKCNSKCSFCNIWHIDNPVDLNVNIVDKLPTSLKDINITGGEPLLHKDFSLIIEKFAKRNCKILINTNGLIRLKRYEQLWKLKNLGIRFSLDGIGKVHDSLRGVKGNYESVIKQIEYLKSINFNNVGISSTFSDTNIDQAIHLYMLSKKLGVEFTCMVIGNSEMYYKKSDNTLKNITVFMNNIKEVIKLEMKTLNLTRWGKVIYMNELLEFINGNIKNIKCPAGNKFFFMQPMGQIYACNMRDLFMGNLVEQAFEKIWFAVESDKIRKATNNCTKPCWTMCNAKPIIFNNKLKFFAKFCRNFRRNIYCR